MASTEPYYTAIIDILADRSDGLNFVKKLRRQEIYTPVLILGAKRAVDDGVRVWKKQITII